MQEDEFIPFEFGELFSDEEEEEAKEFVSIDILTPLPIPAWTSLDRHYSQDFLVRLHQEIDDYLDFMKPTEAEKALRKYTVDRLQRLVSSIWPRAHVNTFGSFDTELYLPSSDIDVVIMDDSLRTPKCLFLLRQALQKDGTYSQIEVIDKAKVPIIKLIDDETQMPVDISVNISNGMESAKIVKSFIKDPICGEGVRALMLIIKQFLHQRHLNEVFSGGLGSYGLLIMIASFLKLHPLIQRREIRVKDNLGILLIEFFELYGKAFNYQDVGIAVDNKGGWYYRKRDYNFYNPSRPNAISIMDPQDETNDVGRGSYNYHLIRSEFNRAYHTMISMIGAQYEKPSKFKSDTKMVTVLGSVLTIRAQVIEHREFLRQKYNEMDKSVLRYQHKRKLVEFVADDSQDDSSIKPLWSDLSDNEMDPSTYYSIPPNNAKLRETDGLDYSNSKKRKKKRRK